MVVDGGDGGAPRPNDGMAVEILLVFSFGCAKGSDEEKSELDRGWDSSPKGRCALNE